MNNTPNTIRCRAQAGTVIQPSTQWRAGTPCSFVYCPSGLHTITAGFRKDESITISVQVDEATPGLLQASFDEMAGGTVQEPFGDEDHESRKATLRFPAGRTRFEWGEVKGVEGVVVSGAEPTSYGAEAVNGRVYRSWSPEFSADADFASATCKDGHWSFPACVRGSASNPARITGVNFCVGALTNKPAFHAMPAVKAKQADPNRPRTSGEALAQLAERRDASLRLLKELASKSPEGL